MKILCFSDLHIGNKAYGKLDKVTGLNSREVDSIKILNQVIDYTIKNKIDVVVFSGDMYKNSSPSSTVVDKVNEAFFKLSLNNIKTFVLDGNHDVSKLSTFSSSLSQFTALNVPNITHSRFLKTEIFHNNDKDYQFVMLPTYYTKDEISKIMENIDTTLPTIIIGHLSIANAQLNDWTIIDNEECIDLDVFKKKNIVSVILGHFHKYQELNNNPFVFYTGSTNRIDFTEEKQEKGFVLLDIDGNELKSHEFIKTNSQKFLTVRLDCKDETDSKKIEKMILLELKKKDLENVILRIQVEVDNNIILDEKEILTYAYENKVQYVLKIQKIIPKKIVANTNYISNNLSVNESIEKYYKNQKREQERILLGKEIVKYVEDGE